jgi:hypothetical protein
MVRVLRVAANLPPANSIVAAVDGYRFSVDQKKSVKIAVAGGGRCFVAQVEKFDRGKLGNQDQLTYDILKGLNQLANQSTLSNDPL